MKLIVCIKQVPEVSELKFDNEKRTLIREGVRNQINPFDRRALTFARDTRNRFGGELVVITMGPPQAKEALLEALAIGADRAVHLLDKAFAGSDTLATSRALSLAIGLESPFDLTLCGKYSIDAETGHIGPEIAELLKIPHVSSATAVEFSDTMEEIVVESETDYGFQRTHASLPALITTAERLTKPSRPTPQEIDAAKSKQYKVVTANELSSDTSKFGLNGSPTFVQSIYSIETKRKFEIIEGPTIEAKVAQLTDRLLGVGLFRGWGDVNGSEAPNPTKRVIKNNKATWVVAESVQGSIRSVTHELLGRGGELAAQLQSELCAVLIGDSTQDQILDMIMHGADKVYLLKKEWLRRYSSDAYAAALAGLISRFNPYIVMAASTSFGRDFVPRVAARLGLGMTSDCIGLELNEDSQLVQLKPAFGGNIVAPILSKTLPQLATVRPGMLASSQPDPTRTGEVIEVENQAIRPLAQVVDERFESDKDALRMDNAEIIVCAGAGIGGPSHMGPANELAEVLEAPIVTTRKVVDLGWLPRQLQVGLTGKSVAPKLYFAIAVSGAFNHMVGVGRAKFIVAINNNPSAPIFGSCDYGIVGDYNEVVPALTEELRKVKNRLAPRASSRRA